MAAPPQASKVSQIPSPGRPLRKPVPEDLLKQPKLSLTALQREKIGALSKEWERTKSGLETAMAGFQPRQGRLDQVQGQLASYSDLSRQFEIARIAAWDKAVGVLNPEQAKLVEP